MKKEIISLEELAKRERKFMDIYNPVHFYCRLAEIGMHEDSAHKVTKMYENIIYKPIIKYLKKRAGPSQ